MTNSTITGLPAGTCKATDVYPAVDTTDISQALTGTDKKYTLSQISDFIQTDITPFNFIGTWNATTNTPPLVSSVGTSGDLYVVSVAGTHNLNGITSWAVGDWVLFNGSVWQKVPGVNTGDVLGPVSSTDDAIATYNGITGKTIQNSLVTLDATGNISGATLTAVTNTVTAVSLATTVADVVVSGSVPPTTGQTLVAIDAVSASWQDNPSGSVDGPASATDNAITRFDGTTGELIQNSTVTLSDTGSITGIIIPSAGNTVSAGRLSTTGADVIVSSAAPPSSGQTLIATSPTGANWQTAFQGPTSATDNALARFNGTTGSLIQNSVVAIDDTGNMTGVTIANATNSVSANLLSTTGADVNIGSAAPPGTGFMLRTTSPTTAVWTDQGLGTGDVTGPGSSTDSAFALFDGTNGLVIKNSPFTLIGNSILSTGVTALTLNTDGNVNVPNSACFWAERNVVQIGVSGDGSSGVCTFNLVFLDQNNNFSGGNIFTAPVNGTYFFQANITLDDLSVLAGNNDASLNFDVDGTIYLGQAVNPLPSVVVRSAKNQFTMQIANFITLTALDTVKILLTVQGGGLSVNVASGHFQGRLIN